MLRVTIFGAGAIGCWVGGRLAAGGVETTLVARPRIVAELASGLRTTDLEGGDVTAKPALATEATAGTDVVLVTVKSAATKEAGETLARVVPTTALVVSLQNGVRNADVLRAAMPGHRIAAGMVPFNVIRRAPGHYHRASAGTVMVERGAGAFASEAKRTLSIEERDDMRAVQWAKLVMNLNNAINALSGIPLVEELGQRGYRKVLSACQQEALRVLRRAGEPVAKVTPVPPRLMPYMLLLPDAIFRRVARQVLAIDPSARSSMWDDFEAGRPTEIDYLQGEIVALGAKLGVPTPACSHVVALVREAERGGRRTYTAHSMTSAAPSAAASSIASRNRP